MMFSVDLVGAQKPSARDIFDRDIEEQEDIGNTGTSKTSTSDSEGEDGEEIEQEEDEQNEVQPIENSNLEPVTLTRILSAWTKGKCL
jgi:hypothetical protein